MNCEYNKNGACTAPDGIENKSTFSFGVRICKHVYCPEFANQNPFKFSVWQRVMTDIDGSPKEVVLIAKSREPSQTCKVYKTEPPVGSGDWIDEDWFYIGSQSELF